MPALYARHALVVVCHLDVPAVHGAGAGDGRALGGRPERVGDVRLERVGPVGVIGECHIIGRGEKRHLETVWVYPLPRRHA